MSPLVFKVLGGVVSTVVGCGGSLCGWAPGSALSLSWRDCGILSGVEGASGGEVTSSAGNHQSRFLD